MEWRTYRDLRLQALEDSPDALLGVTCGDTLATRLYSRAGFVPVGEPQPIREGSHLMGQTMVLEL